MKKRIDYDKEKELIESFNEDFRWLENQKQVFLEFVKGDRTYTGATNVAEKIGADPSMFRSYFKRIKDKLIAKDYPIGYAIATAYTVAKKHFKKLKKKLKK
jgi:hypothetical protein